MKKKFGLFIVLLMGLIYMVPVYATDVQGSCNSISSSIDIKLPNTVHLVILVIQIAVPVLLVIFGMLDLFKGITAQKDEEIKKGQQIFVKRLINAAIIFFVIVIVKLLISFVAGSEEPTIMNCANCFINGVDEDGICK